MPGFSKSSRRLASLLLVLALLFGGCSTGRGISSLTENLASTDESELLVMSFNIRMIYDTDASRRSWNERRADVVKLIDRSGAAIVALQEVENRGPQPMPVSDQLPYLQRELSDYAFACAPESGVLARQPILYDPTLLRLVDEGAILDAPLEDYREGFRGRIASWALFERLIPAATESRLIRVINVHYHHLFTSSQLASSLRIRHFLETDTSPDEALIVLGDFNLPGGSQLLDPLREFGLSHALPPAGTGSFHFFSGITLWPRIDHILVNSHVEPRGGGLVYDRFERGYASDHFPALALLGVAPPDSVSRRAQ